MVRPATVRTLRTAYTLVFVLVADHLNALTLSKSASSTRANVRATVPSSILSKACQHALTLWKKLTRFLEYPELELSTNLAENSMRPVALGRKNWIHIGSPQAGPKVAAILSVVESCRSLRLPVRDYLAAVLPGFGDLPIRCLQELTPAVWSPGIRLKRPGTSSAPSGKRSLGGTIDRALHRSTIFD